MNKKQLDFSKLLNEAEKENLFDREVALKDELSRIRNLIEESENKVNQMVYELYAFTEDEIKIVENS